MLYLSLSMQQFFTHSRYTINVCQLNGRDHKLLGEEVISNGEVMLLPNLGPSRIGCECAEVWLSLVTPGNVQIGVRTDTIKA